MTDVVIAGGGIGGLAAAVGLSRAGASVTVLEAEADFREVGAGLELGPNGSRVLADWGLLEEMRALGVQPGALVIKDAIDGKELTRMKLGAEFEERYGAPYLVGHRSDLLNVLLKAAQDAGVTLIPNEQVETVATEEDLAVVTTSAGNRYKGKLALAADGLNSSLRSELSDDAPVASGYVAYRGTSLMNDVDIEADLENVVLYIGPGCHFVQYPIRKDIDDRGALLNQVAVFQSPAFLRGEDDWGRPEELDEAFATCIPSIRHALSFVPRERRWLMYDREPIDNWIAERMLLIGDSAHPMLQYLAQGACQALEDGRVLQDAVDRQVSLDPDADGWLAAAKLFNQERAPRTARVQRNARLWGESWHVDGIARMLRNLLFSERKQDDYRYTDWLYGKDIIRLP
ncbi:MAG TPA: FAD-dependent monooxygenase [Homoserinimonas sp.]|nr:FAD-dependent monooxygenase [Homoserinimonas sp.]